MLAEGDGVGYFLKIFKILGSLPGLLRWITFGGRGSGSLHGISFGYRVGSSSCRETLVGLDFFKGLVLR